MFAGDAVGPATVHAGPRLDQHRTAAAHRRSPGTARNHRLLDLLLNHLMHTFPQLRKIERLIHPRPLRVAGAPV